MTRGRIHSLLLLKIDTLGDLVLFGPALRQLRAALPEARLSVLIRSAYADLAPMLAENINWITTTVDPFAQGPRQAATEVERVRAEIAKLGADTVVAATSRRTWFEAAVAGGPEAAAARRIALGAETDPYFDRELERVQAVVAERVFAEVIVPPPEEPDWQRNHRIADLLLGRDVPRVEPRLQPTATRRAEARTWLAQHGLESGKFAVCAAAGFANVAIKTWPAENFVAAMRHVRERHRLRTVVIGHESERAHLESVARGIEGSVLWLGASGQLPALAALVAEAGLFLGNDTGALHVAAAVGTPLVGVYGGGTWPRFAPAAQRSIAVVEPLPCFGCGWDCALADAPCVKTLPVADVTAAVDTLLTTDFAATACGQVRSLNRIPEGTRAVMGAAAARYRGLREDHRQRQLKLAEQEAGIAEKEASIAAKEAEIEALKAACDEREKLVIRVHGHAHALTDQLNQLRSEHELLQRSLAQLPADAREQARVVNEQAVHIRNIEALCTLRGRELEELKVTVENLRAGLGNLELAKHYGKLLAEKEAVLQSLQRGNLERERVIRELAASATGPTAGLRKLGIALEALMRERLTRPLDEWLHRRVVDDHWMQIGVLRHYAPRPLRWDDRVPRRRRPANELPRIGLVTPSYGQEVFIERTLDSVLEQAYPHLHYVVQDGGSKDRSAELIARRAARLHHWESERDRGQADAIRKGFARLEGTLGANDIMAWLNSDDLLGPGVLEFVGDYFARNPDVDVIYGHRIIIDEADRDVGRWIMPRHDAATLEWIDYVPQETLFWRKRIWDRAGGIDPSFQFALDWDLLARFQQAGAMMVRVPYFLGAFRVHPEQKTSAAIHTIGAEEMRRIRTRFHGERPDEGELIERHARRTRFRGALTSRLLELGIRW
jgi:ADP-heptose:LPS heptosyltransferase/GT2 family glycosyltransferase